MLDDYIPELLLSEMGVCFSGEVSERLWVSQLRCL